MRDKEKIILKSNKSKIFRIMSDTQLLLENNKNDNNKLDSSSLKFTPEYNINNSINTESIMINYPLEDSEISKYKNTDAQYKRGNTIILNNQSNNINNDSNLSLINNNQQNVNNNSSIKNSSVYLNNSPCLKSNKRNFSENAKIQTSKINFHLRNY